jgi:hypothetical protein
MFPAIIAIRAIFGKICAFLGDRVPSIAICKPIEAQFAKPHNE